MTETDEPFRRYCQEHGLCNRVVFDSVWRMARQELQGVIDAAWGVVLSASPTERQFIPELKLNTDAVRRLRIQLVRLEDALKEVECIKFGDETNKSDEKESIAMELFASELKRRCTESKIEAERTEKAYETAGINSIRYMAIGVREQCDDPRREWLSPETSTSACSGPYSVKTRCGKNARIEMDYRKFPSFGIGVEWGHGDKRYRTIETGKVNLKTGEFVVDAAVCEPEPQASDDATSDEQVDEVSHPRHYKCHPSGVECIQITEHLNFCRGNAVKYIWRAGEKGNEIVDLQKARWYLDREIKRLGGE